ncbi:MAG: adenine deaminase [Candidatus Aenigmatarchaeota archaeon]
MRAIESNVVDVINNRIEKRIVFFGDKIMNAGADVEKTYDFSDYYLLPGLIDAHIHIESSMLTPDNFSLAAVPHGTTCVVFEPHEIANVCGMRGIDYMLSAKTPMRMLFTAPSCVPATNMETSGAELGIDEVKDLLSNPRCAGLGEMMNYSGVIYNDPVVMGKINAAKGMGKVCDGHAPGLSGDQLKKYAASDISSDHECTTEQEALEKLKLGMRIMVREGSAAKNLQALATMANKNYKKCMLVSDDIHADELLSEGHMDRMLRKAVALGISPVKAVAMATINAAKYFKLDGLGAIKSGYYADFVVVKNLKDFEVVAVFINGTPVAENGKAMFGAKASGTPKEILVSVRLKSVGADDLKIASPKMQNARVITLVENQIVTNSKTASLESDGKYLIPDLKNDILPIVVVERHKMTGNVGKGFVAGFGLKEGALASTVAHDSHNIICVGANYGDMECAISELKRMGGGLAAVKNGKIVERLELPIAGLMSDKSAEIVAGKTKDVNAAAKSLGSALSAPFATLSFLALPVIPSLKLTDKGLVDVNQFKFVDLITG